MLGEAEQAAVRQVVLDHRPCDVGLSGQLWTRRLVGELIAKLYRVRLTEPGVGKYLKWWGLSFQRPDERAAEQDPEAVARWHQEIWPKIRAKAKADGGEILFADQIGIRSDQVTGRTWGKKGGISVVRRSGNRFSVNAMSAISAKGRMHFPRVKVEPVTEQAVKAAADDMSQLRRNQVRIIPLCPPGRVRRTPTPVPRRAKNSGQVQLPQTVTIPTDRCKSAVQRLSNGPSTADSQAQSASSTLVTRSTTKAQ
ncbi:winged helix-turn-helix domain-containing protein [Streptomyces niveus]